MKSIVSKSWNFILGAGMAVAVCVAVGKGGASSTDGAEDKAAQSPKPYIGNGYSGSTPLVITYDNSNCVEKCEIDRKGEYALRFDKCALCEHTVKECNYDCNGGIVVCFGCRNVYWREPIAAVWHVKFCPRCCPKDDARWNDGIEVNGEENPLSGSRHLWEHLKLALQQDVLNDPRWVAGAGVPNSKEKGK